MQKGEIRWEGSGANSECYVPSKRADHPLREPHTHSTSINSSTDYSSVKSGLHFAFDATNVRGTSHRRLSDKPYCSSSSPVPTMSYDHSISRTAQVGQNPEPRKITAGSTIDRVPAQKDMCIRRAQLSLMSPADDFLPEKCEGYNCNLIGMEVPNDVFERGVSKISKPTSSMQQKITGTHIAFDYSHRAVSKSSQASRNQDRSVPKVPDKHGLFDAGHTKKCQKTFRKPKPKLALKEIKERELEIRSRELSRERTRCAMEKLFEEIRQLQVIQSSKLHTIRIVY